MSDNEQQADWNNMGADNARLCVKVWDVQYGITYTIVMRAGEVESTCAEYGLIILSVSEV